MKTSLLLLSLTLVLCACPGTHWFPTCKEPGSKCPPVEDPNDPTPYPPGSPFRRIVDGGAEGGRDAASDAR